MASHSQPAAPSPSNPDRGSPQLPRFWDQGQGLQPPHLSSAAPEPRLPYKFLYKLGGISQWPSRPEWYKCIRVAAILIFFHSELKLDQFCCICIASGLCTHYLKHNSCCAPPPTKWTAPLLKQLQVYMSTPYASLFFPIFVQKRRIFARMCAVCRLLFLWANCLGELL